MSTQDSNLKNLLSPARCGTFFAAFRSRSANPEGFDSKMKLWISSIEEWTVLSKKLTISLEDIYQAFRSDTGLRPDKECIRLVFSEMKRRSKLIPLNSLKSSNFWSSNSTTRSDILDNYIDPKGWLSWGIKKVVYGLPNLAISAIASNQNQAYSDLTDMSIGDTMVFVSQKSLCELSEILFVELVRVCKAEKQFCFERQNLLELITPSLNTIIDVTDSKGLEMLDILFEYLVVNKKLATLVVNDCRLVKVANPEDSREDDVIVTKKNVAMVRLQKAKELITADVDKYLHQAQRAKQDALESYGKKEITKAKSLMRSYKRSTAYAEQKYAQLTNVEEMLDDLEKTDSDMILLQAYKDASEALKIANTHLESNMSIMDDMYDATAEASYLNDEMTQMMNDISCVSRGLHGPTEAELEDELNAMTAADNSMPPPNDIADQSEITETNGHDIDNQSYEELEKRLNKLKVWSDPPINQPGRVSTPKKPQLESE